MRATIHMPNNLCCDGIGRVQEKRAFTTWFGTAVFSFLLKADG